jgi:tetratricopeptide (TPR) repeat protein
MQQPQIENLNDTSENNIINNILENTIISEMIQNLDILDNKCRGKIGEDIVEMRIKQLAFSKILFNVYGKDIMYLIKAFTLLGVAYIDINYFEQAQEHLLSAFKLIENINDDMSISSKEFQIKILINLAKCYLENGRTEPAISICEKSLKINQTLMGKDHVSNGDIYYVLSKVNKKYI